MDLKTRFLDIHKLMKFRVAEILLISTEYDAYVLEEDGQLAEQIYQQFNDLSIPYIPRIHWVANAEEAFRELQNGPIHLIITMSRLSDMSSFEFESKLHQSYPQTPIVMLSYDRLTPQILARVRAASCIDRVFYWSGDSKLLLAIIKYIEDKKNVEADSKLGVQAILLVDDSPVYYSQVLPIIFTEILTQTRRLVVHAMNLTHGLLRTRLRPKILLAETYEEALEILETYRDNILGIISDVSFPKDGKLDTNAGFSLAKLVREMEPSLPFLLQSEEIENAPKAAALDLHFLNKNSPNLLHNLRSYIMENYGFGSFIFQYPDGRIIAEANDVTHLERIVRALPNESLYYHASNNHFYRWFRARCEVEAADSLRFVDVKQVSNIEDVRSYILKVLSEYFQKYQSGLILDFKGLAKKDMEHAFIKLGTGSLGGKARGVAFMNAMIAKAKLADKYENMKILVPRSFVIGSDVYETFLEENDLYSFVDVVHEKEAIARKFMESALPDAIQENLRILTKYIKCPLAVRSSSILEDSRVLPFAGIYNTYILPNSHEDAKIRLKQLSDAVKLVYASVFYASPIQYAKNADIRIEEEKMAILIQELVGECYGDYYYPAISGVAQSYNFYPYYPMKPEEGTVSLVLGLGRGVAEGEKVYRFCPAHPKLNPLVSSPREYMQKAQNHFYAVDLRHSADITLRADEKYSYKRLLISQAHKDQALEYIGSTYSMENDCLYDNIHYAGPKVVTFAPLLKYDRLPVTEIINDLLRVGKKSFGTDVEIEFAINIPKDKSKPKEFNFLQIRPMVVGRESLQVSLDEPAESWCYSERTIGNGVYQDLHDIIFVDPTTFQLQDSVQIAQEIGELNKRLLQEGRRCILIGFGRIGTSDRWLGIPVTWDQMSQAMIIVEVDREELRPEPSLGSHFFHNLTAINMGYFHIQYGNKTTVFDWDWLLAQPVLQQTRYVRLVRREESFTVKIDGRGFKGIIYK